MALRCLRHFENDLGLQDALQQMTARRNALQQWQEAGCSGHSIGSLQHPKTLGCRSAQPAPDCLFVCAGSAAHCGVQHHEFCRAAWCSARVLARSLQGAQLGLFSAPRLQILRNFGGRVLAGRNENWEKNLNWGCFRHPGDYRSAQGAARLHLHETSPDLRL